jgi:hypothetical protein
MRKFYKEEARRILAGQKKKSTVLITLLGEVPKSLGRKMLTGKRLDGKACWARDSGLAVCGKAEDGGGKRGGIRMDE